MLLKRKYVFVLILGLLITGSSAYAQKLKGKVRRYCREADIAMSDNNFKMALELYRRAYMRDTTNPKVAFHLGSCMYVIRNYKEQSLRFFEQADRGGITEADYYLGNLYHLKGNFELAIRSYQEYKNIPGEKKFSNDEIDFLIKKSTTAIELMKTVVNVNIENIGSVINSEYPDYVPVISADESVLIFTSRRKGSTGGQLDPYGDYFEDVYISKKKDQQWSPPQSIGSNINTPTHDASVGLSADGETLLLYRTSKDLVSGDLYYSVFDGKDWGVPEKFPEPINTEDFTEPSASSLSADGLAVYFSSDRPGGFGKKDIYRSVKLPNGKWSKALNAGASINTAEDEDSPFIHPDGKTLYFSSKGHKNMGGYDIYKSVLDQYGIWSDAENIGYPINTADDDIYFVLSTNGSTGYYSSLRSGGYGGSDIYLIHFPDNDKGLNVFKGAVEGAESMSDSITKPISAKISLLNSQDNKLEGIYSTNHLTGKFIMIMIWNAEYSIKVESEGYLPYTGKVNNSMNGDINKIILYKR